MEVLDSASCRPADVEQLAVDPHVSIAPSKEASPEIVGVESGLFEKGLQEDEGLGAVIRPGAVRDLVGLWEAPRRRHLDLVEWGDLVRILELVARAKGVSDE